MDWVSFQHPEMIQQLIPVLKDDWTVPVGMVFVCFYGLSRFNSPSYIIELPVSEGTSIRLITQNSTKTDNYQVTLSNLRSIIYYHFAISLF